jgi:hypothetical protein
MQTSGNKREDLPNTAQPRLRVGRSKNTSLFQEKISTLHINGSAEMKDLAV